jgi:hypothetical protein
MERHEFDRHVNAAAGVPRRTLLIGILATLTVVLLFGVLVGGFVLNGLSRQAATNQRHIDCLAAFLIRRNPDGCMEVRDQLVRDGILPAPVEVAGS